MLLMNKIKTSIEHYSNIVENISWIFSLFPKHNRIATLISNKNINLDAHFTQNFKLYNIRIVNVLVELADLRYC